MNIVIIGGGTAGWITAYILSQNINIKTIKVIESSKIPIIGTGEGSTFILQPIIKDIGEQTFLKETNSTHKLGIKFNDWFDKGINYNAPLDVPKFKNESHVDSFKKIVNNKEKIENFYINANLMEKNCLNDEIFRYSYHFDGKEFGQYFKNLLLKKNKVQLVDDEIIDINFNNKKILNIFGKNNTYVADMYIDCTGFRRLLNDRTKHDWISTKEFLPIDSAIPFRLDKKDFFYTVAQAMDYGWMWQIPKKNNLGCGYNFCSDYITAEQAIDEVSSFLKTTINPIKLIKYDSGYIKEPLGENYCFLGISSNFFEPLEATNIHTTVQMSEWLSDYISRKITKYQFNSFSENMLTEFRDLIMFHYRTNRRDTEFWINEYNRTNFPDKLKEQIKLFNNGSLECVYTYLNIYWWFPPAYGLRILKSINK